MGRNCKSKYFRADLKYKLDVVDTFISNIRNFSMWPRSEVFHLVYHMVCASTHVPSSSTVNHRR